MGAGASSGFSDALGTASPEELLMELRRLRPACRKKLIDALASAEDDAGLNEGGNAVINVTDVTGSAIISAELKVSTRVAELRAMVVEAAAHDSIQLLFGSELMRSDDTLAAHGIIRGTAIITIVKEDLPCKPLTNDPLISLMFPGATEESVGRHLEEFDARGTVYEGTLVCPTLFSWGCGPEWNTLLLMPDGRFFSSQSRPGQKGKQKEGQGFQPGALKVNGMGYIQEITQELRPEDKHFSFTFCVKGAFRIKQKRGFTCSCPVELDAIDAAKLQESHRSDEAEASNGEPEDEEDEEEEEQEEEREGHDEEGEEEDEEGEEEDDEEGEEEDDITVDVRSACSRITMSSRVYNEALLELNSFEEATKKYFMELSAQSLANWEDCFNPSFQHDKFPFIEN